MLFPMRSRDDERRLVSRCLTGEAAAWETLWRENLPYVSGALRSCRLDADGIEECCQDLFSQLWEDRQRILGAFEGRSSLAHYLAVIAVRDAFRHARRPAARPISSGLADTVEDPAPGPQDRAEASEQARDLRRASEGLPKREALLIQLVYGEGLAIQEAARLLKIEAGHARVTLHRARELLKKRFIP